MNTTQEKLKRILETLSNATYQREVNAADRLKLLESDFPHIKVYPALITTLTELTELANTPAPPQDVNAEDSAIVRELINAVWLSEKNGLTWEQIIQKFHNAFATIRQNATKPDLNAELLAALKGCLHAMEHAYNGAENFAPIEKFKAKQAIANAEASQQPAETPDPLHMTESMPTPHEGNNESGVEWHYGISDEEHAKLTLKLVEYSKQGYDATFNEYGYAVSYQGEEIRRIRNHFDEVADQDELIQFPRTNAEYALNAILEHERERHNESRAEWRAE